MAHTSATFDLRIHRDAILTDAEHSLARAHLVHYEGAGSTEVHDRLTLLYELLTTCIEERRLSQMISYAESIARSRFNAGVDLREVQCAINVLEEAIWNRLIKEVPSSELAEALGLVSTVLGGAKDALAREYVSLASHQRVPSLNLKALFDGAGETLLNE